MIIVKCDLPCIIVKKKKKIKKTWRSLWYTKLYIYLYMLVQIEGEKSQKSFLKTYVFYVLFRYWHKQVKGHKVTIDIHTTI